MSNLVPGKVFLRDTLLHYFIMRKTSAESFRIFIEVYQIMIKSSMESNGWEVTPQPLYRPDLAPSYYPLFRSVQNALTGIRFPSEQGIKNLLDSCLATKSAQFFWDPRSTIHNPQNASEMGKRYSFSWAIL